jgi:hypothetical protein
VTQVTSGDCTELILKHTKMNSFYRGHGGSVGLASMPEAGRLRNRGSLFDKAIIELSLVNKFQFLAHSASY